MILTAKYVFPISQKPIEDAGVLVRGDKIVEVDYTTNLTKHYPNEEVKDLGQAAIMPGFVNLHTRLERTLLRGTVADEPYTSWLLKYMNYSSKMSKRDKYDSARIGCLEAIRSGTTTVADMASTDGTVNAVNDSGLRAVVYRDVCSPDKNRVDSVMEHVTRDIHAWQDKANSDLVQVGITPSTVFETHPLIYAKASELAAKENLPLQLRLGGSVEELEFVELGTSIFKSSEKHYVRLGYVETPPWLPFGVRPVEYVKNWGAFDADNVSVVHAIHVNDNDIRTLKSHGVGIASCPGSEAQLGMGYAPVSDFLQLGIPVGFGSDTPAASEASGMLREMRIALLLHRANDVHNFLRSSTVLRMGTLGGAKVLHMDDKIGTLEPGKLADITAVDLTKSLQIIELNPISAVINSCSTSDIMLTMVGGNILYENGEFTQDVDYDDLFDKVRSTRAKLTEPV